MKLLNSTDYSDAFLRRMVSWCCKQISLRIREVRKARFTNYSGSYRGTAWHREILVRIGSAEGYPRPPHRYGGFDFPAVNDRLEALLAITTHELTHVLLNTSGLRSRRQEHTCEWHAFYALTTFREHRQALVAEWEKVTERTAARPAPESIVEKRAAKASADLARWMRKLKLAQTKVRRLKRRVAYYAAARQS